MWCSVLMLFKSFLTTAQFPTPLTFSQAEWVIERSGLSDTSDLEAIVVAVGLDPAFQQLEECLSAGNPPPGSQSITQLLADILARWRRFSGASSALLPQPPLLLMGSTHGSSSVSSAERGNSSRASSAPAVPSYTPPSRKRPLPVGPEARLNSAPCTGKRAKALIHAARDSAQVASAVEEMRSRLFAARTWASHLSEMKLYTNFCDARGVSPFPIDHQILEEFVSMMRKHDYCPRSIPQYVSAIFRQQTLLWLEVPEKLRQFRRVLMNGVKRGSGEAHRVLPYTRTMLDKIRSLPAFLTGPTQMFLYRISVLSWFFLLRSDESVGSEAFLGLSADSIEIAELSRQVTITLGVTKNNKEGLLCRRTHSCVCSPFHKPSKLEAMLPLCPYCAAVLLKKDSSEKNPRAPLRPAEGHPAPKSSNLLAFLRTAVTLMGLPRYDSEGQELYGTHSLRRGGAQALVAAGWTLDAIKFFGRWLSEAVELYLLQTPTQHFGQSLSDSMAGVHCLRGSRDFAPGARVSQMVSHTPAPLKSGLHISALLPDLVESPPVDIDLESMDPDLPDHEETSGMLSAMIVSVLPEVPYDLSRFSRESEILTHASYSGRFSDAGFAQRSPADKCVLVQFSMDLPLYVLCLQDVTFSVVS